MTDYYENIVEARDFIQKSITKPPSVGVILGTGLGGLVDHVMVEATIPYSEIPHFPLSTVESHHGNLILGELSGKSVVIMQGRFHVYEGYTLQQITFPVRVLKFLGIETLIVSNACGSMNPNFKRAEIMLMNDHINLLGNNPLVGVNDDRLGPRFPDMSEPYSRKLLGMAETVANELGKRVHQGVYVAVPGPNLETQAEYKFLRTIGADVVGMSTVPENIVARHMNMDVLGISVVTDECFHESLQPVSITDVIAAAYEAEPTMTEIIKGVIEKL
ncbi:MAG: purine-nucleoside phosphorylase [Ignavibacteria bacterium]|nr:purine-nucleoside phosphorylase [Ignavibacteria bacterium]